MHKYAKIFKKYAQIMHKLCQKYAKKTCKIYRPDMYTMHWQINMVKICKNHAK